MNRFVYIQETSARENVRDLTNDWVVVVDQKTKVAYSGIGFHPDNFLLNHVRHHVLANEMTPQTISAINKFSREVDFWPHRRRA